MSLFLQVSLIVTVFIFVFMAGFTCGVAALWKARIRENMATHGELKITKE